MYLVVVLCLGFYISITENAKRKRLILTTTERNLFPSLKARNEKGQSLTTKEGQELKLLNKKLADSKGMGQPFTNKEKREWAIFCFLFWIIPVAAVYLLGWRGGFIKKNKELKPKTP